MRCETACEVLGWTRERVVVCVSGLGGRSGGCVVVVDSLMEGKGGVVVSGV